MRSIELLCLAAAGVAAAGCGGSPVTTYRVAVDETALGGLPASCYAGGTLPTQKDLNPNEFPEFIWTVWSGPSGKSYLDTSLFGETKAIGLGDAAPVSVIGAIESSDSKTYNGTDTQQNIPPPPGTIPPAGYTNTQVLQLQVAFDSTGGTAAGTITLQSQYTCSNCAIGQNDNKVSCGPISMTFAGASIPTQATTSYPNNTNGI
jgi:hypothetical protein